MGQEKMNNGDFKKVHPGIINMKMVDLNTITNPVVEDSSQDGFVFDNVQTIGAGGYDTNKGLIYGIVGGGIGLILLLALVSFRRKKQLDVKRGLDLDGESVSYLNNVDQSPPTLDQVVNATSSSLSEDQQQTRWSGGNGMEYLHYSQSQENNASYDPEDIPVFTDEEIS